MNENLRKRISQLLEKMNERQLLLAGLHQELQNWLLIKSDDEFQRDHDKLTTSCDTLEEYIKQCDKHREQHQLNTDKMTRRSKLLLETLRAYSNDADYYSVYEILIKLKLILFNLLEDNSTLAEKTISNNTLMDVYSVKSDEKQFPQSLIINDDDDEVKNDERLYLLNALMDAPLDDITTFVQKFNWSFEKLCTYQVFEEILCRLQNAPAFSNSSQDEIDQICVYIKTKLTKKYHLNRIEFIQLLSYQFRFVSPNKYRIYLERFVIINKTAAFTLENFYSFYKISTILSKDDKKFATLFSIYCKKLLGEDKSQQSRQPVHTVNSTNRQKEDQANFNRSYQQNQIGRSTYYYAKPLQYNVPKQKNIQGSPQTINKLAQKTAKNNTQYQKQQNKCGINNNKILSGCQMSLSYVY